MSNDKTVNILGVDIREDLEGENHWSIVIKLLQQIADNTTK